MRRYDKLFDLTGRVALVAGGAGAIGAELARGLAEYGAQVAILGHRREAAVAVADDLASEGYTARPYQMEITDERSIQEAVAATVAELGPPWVAINAAGMHIEQRAEEMTPETWDRVLDTNLRGAFFFSQAAAQAMIAQGQGGSIIHLTSVRSTLGLRRGYAAYVASKGGLGLLIKQLAAEWARFAIRVNGIAPTFTRTPMVTDYLNDPAFYDALVQRIPLGRVGETSDLVGLALYLASDASAFLTGQNILIDGGLTAVQ